MRVESSVTSISWIPSEAITGATKLPFEAAFHYDEPPPEVIHDLEALQSADRFRFANELRAWIEVEDGRVTSYGHSGEGHIGSTILRLGSRELTFAAVPFPTLRPDPEVHPASVRFVQTAGGRTGVPAPRTVGRPPFFRIAAPTAWTTLALTIHADGSSEYELLGASAFPRHWIYDHRGKLAAKSGLMDLREWSKHAFGAQTPWGQQDRPALMTEAETVAERQLAKAIMEGPPKPPIRTLAQGDALVVQGERGDELFLVLDGIFVAEVDGKAVAEIGPGAIVGERAVVERGTRTATLRAATRCRVAVARRDQAADDLAGVGRALGFKVVSRGPGAALTREALIEVAELHKREEE